MSVAFVHPRLANVPWPVHFVVALVLCAAPAAGAEWVYSAGDYPPIGRVLLMVSPVVAAGTTVYLVINRRRLRAEGRFESQLRAAAAIRAGRLPHDPAVRAELGQLLPSYRESVSRSRQLPAMFLCGMGMASHVATALSQPRHWVVAALFGGALVAGLGWFPRQRQRVADLEAALGRRR